MSDIILSDGKVIQNAVRVDKHVLERLKKGGYVLTDSMYVRDVFGKEAIDAWDGVATDFSKERLNNFRHSNNGGNVYNMANRDETLLFCKLAPNVPQFGHKADFFSRRAGLISESRLYRFREELIRILVEKNTNDIGYRNMPWNNMFIEVFLEYGNVWVNGIHLVKVLIDPATKEQVYVSDSGNVSFPSRFSEEGVCVFFHGQDKNVAYYSYFTLDKSQIFDAEQKKKISGYACPVCSFPLTRLTKHEYICDSFSCSKSDIRMVYDLSDDYVKGIFRTQKMRHIWGVEDRIRLFICNFLDFYNNREVVVRPVMLDRELMERNQKRIKSKKDPFPDIHVIDVCGHLHKYVGGIKERFGNDIDMIKRQVWVEGHYMRFFEKSHYHILYSNIKDCKNDAEIVSKLAKVIRRDENGLSLPDYQQYRWDSSNRLIYVWKVPFCRNQDEEADSRQVVKVVGGG